MGLLFKSIVAPGFLRPAWWEMSLKSQLVICWCRFCEICSEIAVNVTGVIEHGVVQEWNERRAADANTGANNSSETSCWRGHPFCNFLMACLVITFVLPWFFRVSMFWLVDLSLVWTIAARNFKYLGNIYTEKSWLCWIV